MDSHSGRNVELRRQYRILRCGCSMYISGREDLLTELAMVEAEDGNERK